MIILNFSHPLTESQQKRLEEVTGASIREVRNIPCQLDNLESFATQIAAIADAANLSPQAWQTEHILVNPPAFAPAASTLVAELHGRMGYFPTILRIRPVAGSVPTLFEVAEVLNLQAVREEARGRR